MPLVLRHLDSVQLHIHSYADASAWVGERVTAAARMDTTTDAEVYGIMPSPPPLAKPPINVLITRMCAAQSQKQTGWIKWRSKRSRNQKFGLGTYKCWLVDLTDQFPHKKAYLDICCYYCLLCRYVVLCWNLFILLWTGWLYLTGIFPFFSHPVCYHTAMLYIHVWLLYPCGVKLNFTSLCLLCKLVATHTLYTVQQCTDKRWVELVEFNAPPDTI